MINSVIISLLIIFVTTNINAIGKRIQYTFYNFDVQLKKELICFRTVFRVCNTVADIFFMRVKIFKKKNPNKQKKKLNKKTLKTIKKKTQKDIIQKKIV